MRLTRPTGQDLYFPLARLAPNLNEPLNGPSNQVGDLSIADLDDAVNAIRMARHINTEERALNRACAVDHRFRNDRARFGRIRRSFQNEVPPLRAVYKILDTPDAKTALNKTPILLHLRDHCLDSLRVINDRADRGLQRFDVVFDKEPPP